MIARTLFRAAPPGWLPTGAAALAGFATAMESARAIGHLRTVQSLGELCGSAGHCSACYTAPALAALTLALLYRAASQPGEA